MQSDAEGRRLADVLCLGQPSPSPTQSILYHQASAHNLNHNISPDGIVALRSGRRLERPTTVELGYARDSKPKRYTMTEFERGEAFKSQVLGRAVLDQCDGRNVNRIASCRRWRPADLGRYDRGPCQVELGGQWHQPALAARNGALAITVVVVAGIVADLA